MARVPRIHVADALGGGAIALSEPQTRRLKSVLRLRVGDPLRVFNAADGEWDATLAQLEAKRARVELGARRRPPAPEPGPCLLFAPLKGGRTELIVEKATELGATRLQPVRFRYGVVGEVRLDRLATIAMEAAEQCERLAAPEIAPMVDFAALLADWPTERRLVACVERGDAPALSGLEADDGVLIGPEGGLAPDERERLAAAPFVAYASLGPRVLRAETAAIAALAAAAALSGRWAARPPQD